MKFSPFVLLLFLGLGCHGQTPQPAVPATNATLKELRFELNNLLTLQLPSTYPDSTNGEVYRKTFSANFNRNDSTRLEIPELHRAAASDSIFGGARYYLPFSNIDVKGVRIVTSSDGKYRAVLIPAKPGLPFTYSPFSNTSDRPVDSVTIGWYDHVQDRTLDRAYISWVQFLRKLVE